MRSGEGIAEKLFNIVHYAYSLAVSLFLFIRRLISKCGTPPLPTARGEKASIVALRIIGSLLRSTATEGFMVS